MQEVNTSSAKKRWGWSASLLVMSMALGAGAEAQAQDISTGDEEVVVVTGFRGSLAQSLSVKRDATGFVDAISAEDIADFPDLNLAESVQRIPGVAIDRDSGEGRSIVVRGLGAEFTRVRLNGLEALTTTGGKDGSGGNNRGRQFDFNIFASELFNSITVRKSGAAAVEEGSLGATVDLRAARPFDYAGFQLAMSGQAGYNDLSQNYDPRATFLISNRWDDTGLGDFGALFSVAYTRRNVLEEGSSTGRWENPSVGTAITGTSSGTAFPCPTSTAPPSANYNPSSGAPLTCADIGVGTVNPALIVSPTNPAADGTANALWHPRIPRYGRLTYDQERIGVTTALQWAPTDDTTVSFDFMHASLTGTRQENYLEVIGFSRSGQGVPQMDIVDFTSDAQDRLIAGTFDDTDVRVEERLDVLNTYFNEYTLGFEHNFSDSFRMNALYGQALSRHSNPIQSTASLERYNVDGYSYDYSGDETRPLFDYNFDVTNPNNYVLSNSTATGDASLIRMRPSYTRNNLQTAAINFEWDLNEVFTLQFGASRKEFEFSTVEVRRTANTETAPALAAGDCNGDGVRGDCSMSDITHLVTEFGRNFDLPAGVDTSWIVPDLRAIADAYNIYCNCIDAGPNGVYNSAGPDTIPGNSDDVRAGDDVDYRLNQNGLLGGNRNVEEESTGGYVQLNWDADIGSMRFRGDVGVRQVETNSAASGFVGTTFTTVENSYTDTLPALNMVLEPVDDFQIRFAASKSMSRPDLPRLSPGGSIVINASEVSVSIGNPLLDPIRSTNYDLGFEWYFAEEALLSVSIFYKDIESYQQLATRDTTFDQTGLDPAILVGSAQAGNDPTTIPTTVNQFVNTPGGPLEGYEISYQQPFTFLPGVLADFGMILNYTHVESDIVYYLDPTGTQTVTLPLLNLSPVTWNATLYYENDSGLSARVSAATRDRYLTGPFAGINGNDARGKRETMNVDASASYALNEHLTFTFEGINLTDQADDRWLNSVIDFTESFEHTGRQYYVGLRYKY